MIGPGSNKKWPNEIKTSIKVVQSLLVEKKLSNIGGLMYKVNQFFNQSLAFSFEFHYFTPVICLCPKILEWLCVAKSEARKSGRCQSGLSRMPTTKKVDISPTLASVYGLPWGEMSILIHVVYMSMTKRDSNRYAKSKASTQNLPQKICTKDA